MEKQPPSEEKMSEKLKTTPTIGEVSEIIGGALHFSLPTPGHLIVCEFGKLPEEVTRQMGRIVRSYTWAPQDEEWYADHAHANGMEILICTHGSIDFVLHDGKNEEKFVVNRGEAVFIPPMLWHKVRAHEGGSMLLVLANEPYDRETYVESWERFLELKNSSEG